MQVLFGRGASAPDQHSAARQLHRHVRLFEAHLIVSLLPLACVGLYLSCHGVRGGTYWNKQEQVALLACRRRAGRTTCVKWTRLGSGGSFVRPAERGVVSVAFSRRGALSLLHPGARRRRTVCARKCGGAPPVCAATATRPTSAYFGAPRAEGEAPAADAPCRLCDLR